LTLISFTLVFAAGTSFALSSAKASAMFTGVSTVSNAKALASFEDGSETIFSTWIKTAESKELFIDVSLECGLTTNTMVLSKQLERAVSSAEAGIEVAVYVDGELAAPGWVTFAKRSQTLIAEFAGDYSDCYVPAYTTDADGNVVPMLDYYGNPILTLDEDCEVQEEMVALILDTMSANAFNFIKMNVPVGPHFIEVRAKVSYDADIDGQISDYPVTNAWIGNGSVTVEEVRMVK